ncbi:Dfp1/Him1 [Plectosphaerella plurivora]|uniref:Dfp1/Him1 n=1 Tax=Plectosphaerella plurivora TaxID=936078 RepID=A0A9P8VI57_9PEZI|nr:Dfp1/Him1 [Plectosphaerella plurivora]
MSTRRTPLTNNPNVVNSPLRTAALPQVKGKRSYATVQREDIYGQPPPLKKQTLEAFPQRPPRSPSKSSRASGLPQRTARPVVRERTQQPQQHQVQHENAERIRQWQVEYQSRFPKMVFYFESISEELRAKLSKQAISLGAREERFFSNAITHVVTTRPIPTSNEEAHATHEEPAPEEQPQTINPSLLDRSTDTRRRLFDAVTRRATPLQSHEDSTRRPRPVRNNDILHKARDMGKRIWPLEKFQRMLDILLEPEAYVNRTESSRNGAGVKRAAEEPKLSQLLQHERINGPSDRDQTVTARELVPFKGPYLYVYDIEEKYKPIMLREYPKVNNKYEGEWPQFRTVADGRCPFVEEPDNDRRKARAEKEKEKERAAKAAAESRPTLQPPEVAAPKPVVGKRSLTEMQDGQNQLRTGVKPMDMFHATKPLSKQVDLSGFTSRAPAARLFAGEPVASGVQPSHLTSAIRSQMISSASGMGAIKAGTSKEILGLQRRVLQRTTNSQDPSSRRPEAELDPSSRSTSMGRVASRRLELIEEGTDKASSKPQPAPQKSRRDLKSGYCENCQDKFKDFDEHVLSRKHRKFADNDDNWAELDGLLSQLSRAPKWEPAPRWETDATSVEFDHNSSGEYQPW